MDNRIKVGMRVEAAASEGDDDAGVVHELRNVDGRTEARVGWDSCQETWIDVTALAVEGLETDDCG